MTDRTPTPVVKGYTFLEEISAGDGSYARMLGGGDGRSPHICVAPDFGESERSTTSLGRVVATAVDVPRAEGARP